MPPKTSPIPRPRSRRRPPRPLGFGAVLLRLALLPLALAQSTTPTTVSSPSTRTFKLAPSASAFVYLPTTASSTVYLTLSLCAPPSSLSSTLNSTLAGVLFLSNSSDSTTPGPSTSYLASADLNYGFANLTSEADSGAWIGVWAPATGSSTEQWTFSLGVSTTAPLVVLDPRPGLAFDDADATTALLSTANYSQSGTTASTPAYSAFVIPTSQLSDALASSTCYIANASTLVPQKNVDASITTRGWSGGLRVQFEVGQLEAGTNYTAWMSENVGGGVTRLSEPVAFATQTGTNCRLVHSISFCPEVAYAVPAPVGMATSTLLSLYNSTLSPSLANFKRSLSLFPCDDLSMGPYSCNALGTDMLVALQRPKVSSGRSLGIQSWSWIVASGVVLGILEMG
ncbi:hypothetical protein RQP46_002375 [Phenoliferia psychrophenolica]